MRRGNTPHSRPAREWAGSYVLGSRVLRGALFLAGPLAPLVAAQQLPDGAVAARLEVAAPDEAEFILRGTLPVPRLTYPRPNLLQPFRILNPDGTLAFAQTEIVSRYPSPTDGANVVEILARVRRPEGVPTGARITYDVISQPHRQVTFQPGLAVEQLLATPDALLLRSTDAFDHAYQTDLYEDVRAPGDDRFRTLRRGLVASTEATHQLLLPVQEFPSPWGTLPHMMGVHAYVTRWMYEEFLSLDLRVHNASSGMDDASHQDDPLADLYFGGLELRLPGGWIVLNSVDDPFFGAPYVEGDHVVWPIVAPYADGRKHLLPQMGQFERRLVIVHDNPEAIARARAVLREQNLAFNRPGTEPDGRALWSWWNPLTRGYFPQRRRLPDLTGHDPFAMRAADQAELSNRLQQVQTGSAGIWPAIAAGMGWAHPWGVSEGGMVSGQEIWLYDGIATAWAASTPGYRMHQLRHRMYTDRQRNVLFNAGGQSTAEHQWIYQHPQIGPYLPIWWFNGPMLWASDPFGFGGAPQFQNVYVTMANLKPPYEDALLSYETIDEAHLGRYTHDAKALVWLGNDAIAKDDLRTQAEGFRLGYSELPQDPWNAVIPSGLLAAEEYVLHYPGNGFPFGRREGWCVDTVAAAYATQDDAWRARTRPWVQRIVDVLEAGQSTCNGTIQATVLLNVFNGQYRCRQQIEAAITEHALVGVRESVFGRADPATTARLNGVILRSCEAMISPVFWNAAAHAPWSLVAVGPGNTSLPLFCDFIPPDGNGGYHDNYQCWSSFAYGYELSGNPEFLLRAQEMLGQDLLTGLHAHALDNLENWAALLEMLQMQ